MFKFSVQEGRFSFRVLVLCLSRFHSGTHRGPVNLDVISPKQSLVLSNAKSNFIQPVSYRLVCHSHLLGSGNISV